MIFPQVCLATCAVAAFAVEGCPYRRWQGDGVPG